LVELALGVSATRRAFLNVFFEPFAPQQRLTSNAECNGGV
jgi:hypothetical protein